MSIDIFLNENEEFFEELYYKDNYTICFGTGEKIKKPVFHPNTQCIYREAFRKNSDIKEIVLPPKCEFIEKGAFNKCPKLEKIIFPKGEVDFEFDCFSVFS